MYIRYYVSRINCQTVTELSQSHQQTGRQNIPINSYTIADRLQGRTDRPDRQIACCIN